MGRVHQLENVAAGRLQQNRYREPPERIAAKAPPRLTRVIRNVVGSVRAQVAESREGFGNWLEIASVSDLW
jgi:hypothetical protein